MNPAFIMYYNGVFVNKFMPHCVKSRVIVKTP